MMRRMANTTMRARSRLARKYSSSARSVTSPGKVRGVLVEEIARLVGHAGGSGVTERIYRKELRPAITTGAEILTV
jgi:hypothetical protein